MLWASSVIKPQKPRLRHRCSERQTSQRHCFDARCALADADVDTHMQVSSCRGRRQTIPNRQNSNPRLSFLFLFAPARPIHSVPQPLLHPKMSITTQPALLPGAKVDTTQDCRDMQLARTRVFSLGGKKSILLHFQGLGQREEYLQIRTIL